VPFFRRRHERRPCRLGVRVDTGRGRQEARAFEISNGGLSLQPSADVTVDSVIELDIEFPGTKKRFHVRGRVRSVISEGPQRGIGIEFLFDSKEQKAELGEHVAGLTTTG
jgi:hypothetical protein